MSDAAALTATVRANLIPTAGIWAPGTDPANRALDALAARLAEAEAARENAEREKAYWARNYDAQYRGSKLEAAEARVAALEAALRETLTEIHEYTECDCDEESTCLIHRVEDIVAPLIAVPWPAEEQVGPLRDQERHS
jgi:exonuclease VII large subunit